MAKIELTNKQIETIIWELSQGVTGEGDAYDRMLKKIISRIKEQSKWLR